jgi:hypothetical protein
MRRGVFDHTGVAHLRIQVPPGSSLAGSTISAQASVESGGAPLWTNLINIPLE